MSMFPHSPSDPSEPPISPGSSGASDLSGSARPRYDRARIASAAGLPIDSIEVTDVIGSTSTELMQRAFAAQAAPPRVLVAVEQTAGRGRRGRGWLARPHCSMALSVAIERAVDARSGPRHALSLALGVAIAERLADFGCALRLKWPNDLQRDGAKVAGLLVESRRAGRIERVVVGCGLNLLPDARLAAEVDQPVAALFDAPAACDAPGAAGWLGAPDAPARHAPPGSRRPGPSQPDRSPLAGALVDAIVRTCMLNATEGFAPWRAGWQRLDALVGQPVRVRQADGSAQEGVACGVDDDGALRLQTPAGQIVRIWAGEASVRVADRGGVGRPPVCR